MIYIRYRHLLFFYAVTLIIKVGNAKRAIYITKGKKRN